MSRSDDAIDAAVEIYHEAALSKAKKKLPNKGYCPNCLTPLKNKPFCDPDCEEDFNKRNRMQRG